MNSLRIYRHEFLDHDRRKLGSPMATLARRERARSRAAWGNACGWIYQAPATSAETFACGFFVLCAGSSLSAVLMGLTLRGAALLRFSVPLLMAAWLGPAMGAAATALGLLLGGAAWADPQMMGSLAAAGVRLALLGMALSCAGKALDAAGMSTAASFLKAAAVIGFSWLTVSKAGLPYAVMHPAKAWGLPSAWAAEAAACGWASGALLRLAATWSLFCLRSGPSGAMREIRMASLLTLACASAWLAWQGWGRSGSPGIAETLAMTAPSLVLMPMRLFALRLWSSGLASGSDGFLLKMFSSE